MAVVVLLSLWPFTFFRRWKSPSLYLPVAGIFIYGICEWSMPEGMLMGRTVVPMLLFLWVNGMAKVALLAVLLERSRGSRRRLRGQPQRLWQVALELPILATGLALWFWTPC